MNEFANDLKDLSTMILTFETIYMKKHSIITIMQENLKYDKTFKREKVFTLSLKGSSLHQHIHHKIICYPFHLYTYNIPYDSYHYQIKDLLIISYKKIYYPSISAHVISYIIRVTSKLRTYFLSIIKILTHLCKFVIFFYLPDVNRI